MPGEQFPGDASGYEKEIEYNLFEEFDVGAHSFLHATSLDKLRQADLINDEALRASKEIRRMWLELQDSSWTTEEIKVDAKWRNLFSLCDRLLRILKRPGDR